MKRSIQGQQDKRSITHTRQEEVKDIKVQCMTHCNFSDKEKTKTCCENLKNRCEQMEIDKIRQKITKITKKYTPGIRATLPCG